MPITVVNTNNFEHTSLSAVLTSITDNTDLIKQNLNEIKQNIDTIKNNMGTMRTDIRTLKVRGDTNILGVCTKNVYDLTSISRAVTIIGAKTNNDLSAISSEMNNPTPV